TPSAIAPVIPARWTSPSFLPTLNRTGNMKLPGFLKRASPKPGSHLSDELRREIRQSFDEASRDEEHFPSTIDPRILHVQVLLRFFAPVANHRLLDAGCGKGRY